MTLLTDVLAGVAPRFLTHPEIRSTAGLEAVELAASAGLHLDPWQVDALEVILGERADGKWAAREVGLIVPRQNGKGAILEALELFWLFLSGEALVLHSAHEFKTAKEAFLRIRQKVTSTPDLNRRVLRVLQNNNDMSIELRSGQRLRFVARTGGSGRGFSGDKVVLDEAFNLADSAVSALAPTMSAVPNPQVVISSSAPLSDLPSAFLRRFCKRGREGSPTLAYLEWCADPAADLDDREAWAASNPGYPFRIDDEAISLERGMMLDADFARERLGLWLETVDGPQIIPADAWAGCVDSQSGIDGQQIFALEVSEDRAWSTFAAAGRSTRGDFVHVEVVDPRPGTGWVVARAVELQAKWGGKLAVSKASPAASLIPDLLAAGVDVDEVSTEDHAKSCGRFFDMVVNGAVVHRSQTVLDKSVAGAAKRDYGDAWVWSRRRSSVDISPLVAVTLAAGQYGTGKRRRVSTFREI